MERTGCFKCWARDASDAWRIVTDVPIEAWLVDEAHFVVAIRACDGCGQQYLQVSTEMVDWLGGDDPSWRTVIPIDAAERATLGAAAPIAREVLEGIGSARRSLHCDSPKGQRERVYWGIGLRVGTHD